MGSKDGSNSFEALIHADREKKKREDLANQILGRSRSSQNVKKPQKDARSPSLASRMGVTKRSSSTSIPTQRNTQNPPSRPSSTTPSHRNGRDYTVRNSRIANEIDSGNANITSRNNSFTANNNVNTTHNRRQNGQGLSIKGSAGPFTVQLSNFAPGTTLADIESAFHDDAQDSDGNNCMQSCRITSTRPNVVAEMVITERKIADKIVNKFDDMRADGLVLKVQIVKTGAVKERNGEEPAPEDVAISTTEEMDMDEQPEYRAYEHDREAADRDRRERERNRDFGGRRDDRREPRDRREERDDRRDRDRDRHHERERERDRDYERRDAPPQQPQQQQQQQPPVYDNRPNGPPQQPQYGGGPDRPPYMGGGYRYGGQRGYGFSRGGYGGRGSGGYRGYGSR